MALKATVGKAITFHMSFFGHDNQKASGLTIGNGDPSLALTLAVYQDDQVSATTLDSFGEIDSTGEYSGTVTFPSVGTWQVELRFDRTGEYNSETFQVVTPVEANVFGARAV